MPLPNNQVLHEIVDIFAQHKIPLAHNLVEMLNEDYSHRTERRGCGYTQATRAIATHINQPRRLDDIEDIKLFDRPTHSLRLLTKHPLTADLGLEDWRDIDLRADLLELANTHKNDDDVFWRSLNDEISFQNTLRHIDQHMSLEESHVFVKMLSDIILPRHAQQENLIELACLAEKPKVGSCTMAEKFFLEIVFDAIPRKGRVNIIVDEHNQPILIEKINMGDSHSCISVAPVMMNGVIIPPASLFSVAYDENYSSGVACKQFKGEIIPAKDCQGFYFLRLTTLSISPQNRHRAFSAHYEWQSAAGLFSHKTTEISQLRDIALQQL